MTQPSIDTFFTGGGGGKSISWKDKPIGSTVSGVIKAVNPPQQQTDPKDGSLQYKKNGEPKMSVRIDLETDFRSFEMCKPPEDPNEVDDGERGLYVQGFMQGAIGDALRKAGRHGAPEVGGHLTVKLVERRKNDNPVLSPINIFEAVYSSPTKASTDGFFGGESAPANGLSSPATMGPAPQKPASMNQAAWDAMDDATKRSVAEALGDIPPF